VRGLAWILCGLGLAGAAGVVVLDVLDRSRIQSFHDAQPPGIVLAVSFCLLGALIVSRRPQNRIGWIYLLIGVAMPVQALAVLYYEKSVISGGLPAARWSAWLNAWVTFLVFPAGLAFFAFLLYPDGRLPSRRWRPVAQAAIATTAVGIVITALDPTSITVSSGFPPATNPVGIAALRSIAHQTTPIYLLGMVLITAAILDLVRRGRRGPTQERQQIKLLAYAATITIGALLVATIVSLSGAAVGNTTWDIPVVLGFGIAVPVACGLAILRHGLYEIDRLISRTLSYAIVTGTLAAVFVGTVVLTTDVLPFSSPVAVAASTLTAAALFNPLRSRVQRAVDRRFNRARFDAERTVEAFARRLRDAVDLDTVRDGLMQTIDQAVEPAHVTVWVRDGA